MGGVTIHQMINNLTTILTWLETEKCNNPKSDDHMMIINRPVSRLKSLILRIINPPYSMCIRHAEECVELVFLSCLTASPTGGGHSPNLVLSYK